VWVGVRLHRQMNGDYENGLPGRGYANCQIELRICAAGAAGSIQMGRVYAATAANGLQCTVSFSSSEGTGSPVRSLPSAAFPSTEEHSTALYTLRSHHCTRLEPRATVGHKCSSLEG